MRLSWLVLVGLVVLAGHAHARALPDPTCACPTRLVLPERGTAAVPPNARSWVVEAHGAVHYPARVPADQLMGVTATDDSSIATRSDRDDVPPAAPRNVTIAIESTGGYADVESIALQGDFDPDTALVRIDIDDGSGVVSMLTTPWRLNLCEPGFQLASRFVTVEVRSIDLAGNESAPHVTRRITAVPGDEAERLHCSLGSEYPERHHRCGTIFIAYFVIGIPILFVLLLVLLVRGTVAKRHVAEELSRLVADGVVRRLLRWNVVWAAMLVGGAIGMNAAGSDAIPAGLSVLIMTALYRLHRTRQIQRMLEHPAAVATRRGPWLFVETPERVSKLRASNADFEQAKRTGVPTSIAR
jgi:hypothetical protein